ncbi:MAG: hypothetical protein H0Z29_10940 [Candidatus Marinimicrobia bacterium]|nr:hypothetical protein [Candidatus Neomarinimicrobiota bacterium]
MNLKKGKLEAFLLILTISFVIIYFGCAPKIPSKSDLPKWTVGVELPLFNEVITADSLFNDSLIVKVPLDDKGNYLIAFKDTIDIDSSQVGNQLEINDIHHEYSQSVEEVSTDSSTSRIVSKFEDTGINPVTSADSTEIGEITLDDVAPDSTAPFTFREVMPDDIVSELENLIKDGGGSTTVDSIKSADLKPQYKTFTFDNFKSANFISGNLKIEIVNKMIVTLGSPINVSIEKVEGEDTVIIENVQWDEEIDPGNSSSQVIDLSGKTLPGNILVKVSGHSAGTKNQSIDISEDDLDSRFYVVISAENLVVSSAEAKVPEQIVEDNGNILIDDPDNKVQSAKVYKGKFKITVLNDLSLEANIEVRVPSIRTPNGEGWSFVVNATGKNTTQEVYPIDNYEIVINDINNQQLEYEYTVRTVDTGEEFCTVNMHDKVKVNFDIYGSNEGEDISFSEFTGITKAQEISDEGKVDVSSSEAEIVKATVKSGSIVLRIDNGINLDNNNQPHLVINIPQIYESEGSDQSLTREFDISSGKEKYVINLSGKEIRMQRDKQFITYTTNITTQSNVISSYNLIDSIITDIIVPELTFQKVTGYFNKEPIEDSDNIILEEETKVDKALIKSGTLRLNVKNNMGVIANVNFLINEIVKDGREFNINFDLPASPDPLVLEYPLNGYIIDMDMDNQVITYNSSVTLPSTELMTLEFGEDIDIDVDLGDIKFERVTGYLDTVRVEIDTIAQEIGALPEGLDGLEFEEATLKLVFNTNIGVPVILDLTIVAENDNGEKVTKHVRQDITENNVVNIPQAEDLFNIFPTKIIAFGKSEVGGNGSVSEDQYIVGKLVIELPFSLIIKDGSVYEGVEPSRIEDEIPDEIQAVKLFYEYENQMSLGAIVDVLVAEDTSYFNSDIMKPETLASIYLFPDTTYFDSTFVDEEKMESLRDSSYIKPIFRFQGIKDKDGNPLPSRLIATDSLVLTIYSRIYGEINPEELIK